MSSKPARTGWDPLVAVSLIAGVGFTASAEYQLARTIGAPVPVAVLLPLALDVYVVAAIRRNRGRDIALALVLMGVAQVSAHMLEAGVVPISVPLVAAVSVLVPLVVWRVHALAVLPGEQHAKTDASTGPAPTRTVERVPAAETPSVPASSPVPVPPVSRPELTAVPGQKPTPVPVRRTRTSTGKKATKKQTAAKASTASFDEHVRTATAWLTEDPDLSGTAIGNRLGTGDSYGRRVRRAALGTGTAGPAHPTNDPRTGQGGEGYN